MHLGKEKCGMITILAKFFVKEKEDKGKIRQVYGMLCGIVGIF